MSNTVQYGSLEDTLISSSSSSRPEQAQAPLAPPASAVSAAHRTTVLPRVEWNGSEPNVVPFQRARFEELGTLGQGGMGEVVLLKDHDIERNVALKRLTAPSGADFVFRFVEEIRTVGQLDHPNIVPLHDVGIDDLGRYYFVMKHLQGDTLEAVIDKLRQGDREAHKRFTFPVRVQIFRGILQALAFAHRKGIIHRDLKPSNIMVGPFGEVTVMDWGLARRVRTPEGKAAGAEPAPQANVSLRDAAMLRTQVGAVMGTPLYMSPEQARGQHDQLDERSDIYSLTVLLYEFLYLRHYLDDRQSLNEILEGVQTVTPDLLKLDASPHQSPVPSELAWYLSQGFAKDPAMRFPSIDAMMQELKNVEEGHIVIHCQRTMLKRGLHELLRRVDAHPMGILVWSTLAGGLVLASMIYSVVSLLR